MARRGGDVPSQNDLREKTEKHQEDMRERGEDVERAVSDVETVRRTLESLDAGGTSEAADAVERAIEGAESVGVTEFGEESEKLEQIHGESQEHEGELQERSDSVSADVERISDASGRLNSDAVRNELVEAKEADMRDIEFLGEQARRAQDAKEQSRRLHEEHQSRVNAGRRS